MWIEGRVEQMGTRHAITERQHTARRRPRLLLIRPQHVAVDWNLLNAEQIEDFHASTNRAEIHESRTIRFLSQFPIGPVLLAAIA